MFEWKSPLASRNPSLDDYLGYFGEDLKAVWGDAAQAFLERTETRLCAFLNSNLCRDMDRIYKCLTDKQKSLYKMAVLEQARYDVQFGTIGSEAGLDVVNLHALPNQVITLKTISPQARNFLMSAGIWTMKMSGYSRDGVFPFGGGC